VIAEHGEDGYAASDLDVGVTPGWTHVRDWFPDTPSE
jgi:hypothetical protein